MAGLAVAPVNNPTLVGVGSSSPTSGLTAVQASGGLQGEGGIPVNADTINQPASSSNTVTNSGDNSSGGSSTTPGSVSGAAYYNDIISQLQAQLSTAQGEQPTLINNITNSANDSENQLNQQESTAETGYNTQSAEDAESRANSIDQINENAGSTYNALMSILGGAGSGVSSAAQFTAPQAVALQSGGQRSGADTTYNTNEQAIGSDEATTQQQYQDALTDLLSQENTDKGTALSSLLNSEAGINQQITQAQTDANEYAGESFTPAQQAAPVSAVNSIESQLGQIFSQYATPTFSVSPVTASTPTLTGYNTDPLTLSTQSANPTTESAFEPYFASVNNNQNNNLLTGATAAPPLQQQTAGATA